MINDKAVNAIVKFCTVAVYKKPVLYIQSIDKNTYIHECTHSVLYGDTHLK